MKKIHPKKFVFNYQKKMCNKNMKILALIEFCIHHPPQQDTTCLSFKKEFVYFSPYPTTIIIITELSTQNKKPY